MDLQVWILFRTAIFRYYSPLMQQKRQPLIAERESDQGLYSTLDACHSNRSECAGDHGHYGKEQRPYGSNIFRFNLFDHIFSSISGTPAHQRSEAPYPPQADSSCLLQVRRCCLFRFRFGFGLRHRSDIEIVVSFCFLCKCGALQFRNLAQILSFCRCDFHCFAFRCKV